jgi:5,5'-dehydrodivanillate O-demethylase
MPNINQVRIQVQIEGTREDAANLWADRLFWRVPVDDNHSVSYASDWIPLTGKAAEDYQRRRQEARKTFSSVAASHNEIATDVLAGKMAIKDVDPSVNMYELFLVEDYTVQVGQGAIAPRAQERLGRLDAGMVILRLLWERELAALQQGRPLKQWKTPAGLADESVVVEKVVSSQPDIEGRFAELDTSR